LEREPYERSCDSLLCALKKSTRYYPMLSHIKLLQ
jgi:hypothetical protein